MRRFVLGVPLAAVLALAGCGGSGDDGADVRDSLELAAEAASLEAETGELVGALSGDPSDKQRQALQQDLASLDQRAAELISSAGADSTYQVALAPVNGSGTDGEVTLVESGGEIAIEGAPGGSASIHGFAKGGGASICPPAGAATGADSKLSGDEAEDFYGPVVAEFSASAGGNAPADGADPVSSRVLVISKGGKPVACGIPVAGAGSGATPSEEIVAGTQATRGALSELSTATKDLASDRAKQAQRRANQRLARANRQLRQAVNLAVAELDDDGELSEEDQAAVDDALAQINGSKKSRERALAKLKGLIAAQLAAKAERERQRQEAIAAAQAPAPSSEPTYSAPAPSPSPGPSVVIK